MHSIILILAYRPNDKFMLSILLINPKIITSMQQKHELQKNTLTRASSNKCFVFTTGNMSIEQAFE